MLGLEGSGAVPEGAEDAIVAGGRVDVYSTEMYTWYGSLFSCPWKKKRKEREKIP